FAGFGLKTILFRKQDPILGTVINQANFGDYLSRKYYYSKYYYSHYNYYYSSDKADSKKQKKKKKQTSSPET
ncbi:MAG: hypothetical protein IJL75_06300, partial [Eubacterium sp.]|nr:hypothetical protein [Eubacterium sp.]